MTSDLSDDPLPIQQVGQLDRHTDGPRWLVRQLWAHQAVGFIGGPPKCCKSWLGLDLAVSVASGTACLGRFEVTQTGPALVYLAEDALGHVRDRIAGICHHRGLDLHALDLHVITADALRLDRTRDQQRLHDALLRYRPRLLLLDPLIRLHRLDENSSAEISRLLGFLRQLQREHGAAIALVHHASKRSRARPGQALRGSSDLHAFVDSLAYLARRDDELLMHLEHRSAPTPEPVPVRLVHGPGGKSTHLQVIGDDEQLELPVPLEARVMELLDGEDQPRMRKELRERLRVNNQRLGKALEQLERDGEILRTDRGWLRLEQEVPRAVAG